MNLTKEIRQEIKMYQANDYEISEETPTYILMKKNTASGWVHLILALCFWWLIFIPNLIYHLGSVKKKKIMK